MIRVTIGNEMGKLTMGGYDAPVWRIIDFDGLGIPTPERNVQTYAGQIGQVLIGETVPNRPLTLSGELVQTGDMSHVRTCAHRILNRPVLITIDIGRKRRCINARCTTFKLDKANRYVQTWVMQFICDDPRFRDITHKKASVFECTKLIDSSSKTPCKFSIRTNKVSIKNAGDYVSEPVFELYTKSEYDGQITVLNHTTGQSIQFRHKIAAEDMITVDIPNRKITSNKDGIITHTITDDTFLSDFKLELGQNEIQVVSENLDLSAVCKYYNYYAEAVL